LARSKAGKALLKWKVLLLPIPALTLGFNMHHHCSCKPLASWLRETTETLLKTVTVMDFVAHELSEVPAVVSWEVLVAAHELGEE